MPIAATRTSGRLGIAWVVAAFPLVLVLAAATWFGLSSQTQREHQADQGRHYAESAGRVLGVRFGVVTRLLGETLARARIDAAAPVEAKPSGTRPPLDAVLAQRLTVLREAGSPIRHLCLISATTTVGSCGDDNTAKLLLQNPPTGDDPLFRWVIPATGSPLLQGVVAASRTPGDLRLIVAAAEAEPIFREAAVALNASFFMLGKNLTPPVRTDNIEPLPLGGGGDRSLIVLTDERGWRQSLADALDGGRAVPADGDALTLRRGDQQLAAWPLPRSRTWNAAPQRIYAVFSDTALSDGELGTPDFATLAACIVLGLYSLGLLAALRRQARTAHQAAENLAANQSTIESTVNSRTRALTESNQRLQLEIQERERAEEKTLRQQVFLMTAVDSLPYPFLVVDAADFSVKLANRSALERNLAGKTSALSCHRLIHGYEQPCMGTNTPCVLREIYRKKSPGRVEHKVIDARGRTIIYEVHGFPILDDRGRLSQIIEYFVDITEQKRSEEMLRASERKYRELIESTNSVVLRWDRTGSITFINGFGEKFFGYSAAELVGRPLIGTIFPQKDAAGVDLTKVIKRVLEQPDRNQLKEIEARRKDGSRVWISWANKAILDDLGAIEEILSFGIDVTQRRMFLEALRESEARFRNIYENSLVMMHSLDEYGCITSANRKWVEETGYTLHEVEGKPLENYLAPESRAAFRYAQETLRLTGRIEDAVYQFVRRSGEFIDLLVSTNLISEPNGRVSFLAAMQNITRQKQAEKDLRLAASVFENSFEGIIITDASERILQVNHAFTAVTGYSAEEALGRKPSFLASGKHEPSFFKQMWNSLNREGFWHGEILNRRKNGEIYPEWLSISTVFGDDGAPSHFIGLFTDITDKKTSEEHIFQLAHYDVLTNLPNRVLFQDRLDHALMDAKRTGTCLPLLFLDLDRFKPINDSFGHDVGDLLLTQVGARLRDCVRESDTVARMGGDEFTVILEGIALKQDYVHSASQVAVKILTALARPFNLEGREVFISASIGVVVYPNDGRDSSELVRNADTAMYHAKHKKGRNNFVFYEPQMNAKAADRLLIENSMRKALARDEFELFFQPCIRLLDGTISSLEALVRWNHPERGMIPPDEFIRIAEETGLIVEMGEWVLREALRWLSTWRAEGFDSFRVAVNLSLRQFRHRDLVNVIHAALDDVGLPPAVLALEVTESTFFEDEAEVVERLETLNGMGVEILIDDFGTGYSSLERLRAMPINVLKVDRSFVRDITTDADDERIVAAVIAMAHSLQMQVIAEGVQTEEQLQYLEALGCDQVQGFLFSLPIPGADVSRFLRETGMRMPLAISKRA